MNTKQTKDIIKNIVMEMDKDGCNPIEIKSLLNNTVFVAINEVLNEKYIKVIFDSPEGNYSAKRLENKGYATEWKGFGGCRGETVVYLPREADVKEFKNKLNELELIDNYSVVTVRDNYKNTII